MENAQSLEAKAAAAEQAQPIASREDCADGTAAGITGTPTTLIRHNRTGATEVVVGALPAERLTAVLERMLEGGR